MERNNIILIGMSGAGKSTLGVLLAKALGRNFVDTDIAIQQQEGMLLQEIIDQKGVDEFLRIEEGVVSALHFQRCVVATGGSVIYSERAMAALQAQGTVVYLSVPAEELKQRLTNITTRGIVMRSGTTIDQLIAERLPLYEKYGEITVNCAQMDIESSVRQLVDQLS